MSDTDTATGWHLVRVTLEALSPLSCAAGQGQEGDVALVRDANGLPMIPGATLQGLLRTCLADRALRDELFGFEKGKDTVRAKLAFSNALVHGSDNVAVAFPAKMGDPLLEKLAEEAPVKRDHVRLDDRHGAVKGGKFDRAAVPAGARFSFEVLLRGSEDEKDKLAAALSGLKHPLFRIGGSGRRGYGRVEVHEANWAFFLADQAEEFRILRAKPLSLHANLVPLDLRADGQVLTVSIALKPVQPWRTGQGPAAHGWHTRRENKHFTSPEKPKPDPRQKAVDLVPVREPSIVWQDTNQRWQEPSRDNKVGYVLPASGVRGPLLHRTVFHWNLLRGNFADANTDGAKLLREAREALNGLFGFVRDGKPAGDEAVARASPLFIDDVPLKVSSVEAVDHIRIDRFTGGVVQGALYSQELVETARLDLAIRIDAGRAGELDGDIRKAFLSALRDLAEGRLALGAKSLGFCTSIEGPHFSGEGKDAWEQAWQDTARAPKTVETV